MLQKDVMILEAQLAEAIDKCLEKNNWYEDGCGAIGIFGHNMVALAARAAVSVIAANFDGQETAVEIGSLEEPRSSKK